MLIYHLIIVAYIAQQIIMLNIHCNTYHLDLYHENIFLFYLSLQPFVYMIVYKYDSLIISMLLS